ncbi:MAG: hypothetical protein JNL60_10175 [Bacteroidia bacterium]|nr:hypothetical protein [Bacteroidia bacterium]
MKWSSSKDNLPHEGEEVLVFINKKFDIAQFKQSSGGFRLRDGTFLWIEQKEVMWAPLIAP